MESCPWVTGEERELEKTEMYNVLSMMLPNKCLQGHAHHPV